MSSTIALAADRAVDAATQDTTYVAGTNEPSLVARLVAALPDLLVQQWRPHFPSGLLHVSSAFCHQRPQVHWDAGSLGSGRPELCDLLLLVASPDSTGAMSESALLVQAKCGTSGQSSLNGVGDVKQRYMYASWPEFHFAGNCTGSAARCMPKSQRYQLRPHSGIDLGARYGIVSESGSPTWYLEGHPAAWSPASKSGKAKVSNFDDVSAISVAGTVSLGEALEQMVNKSLGRHVHHTLSDDWSRVIARLVEHAIELTHARKLHLVQHAPAAPLVPLASACTFVTNDARRLTALRLTDDLSWPFGLALPGPYSWQVDGDGGYHYTAPPNHAEGGEFNDGFGIIRVVVAGRLKEDSEGGRMSDHQASD